MENNNQSIIRLFSLEKQSISNFVKCGRVLLAIPCHTPGSFLVTFASHVLHACAAVRIQKMNLCSNMKGVFDAATTSLPKPFNDSSFFNVEEKKTRYTVNTKKEAKNTDGQVVHQHTMKSQLKSGSQFESHFFCFESKKDR